MEEETLPGLKEVTAAPVKNKLLATALVAWAKSINDSQDVSPAPEELEPATGDQEDSYIVTSPMKSRVDVESVM